MKYVWLNIKTGEFSNSWSEAEENMIDRHPKQIENDTEEGWKLIKYECTNNEDFEFTHRMRIT